MESARVIVYDLDGTLYDDEDHFDVYARELRTRLPAARRDAFWTHWLAAREGRHPLRVGTVFDVERAWVLQARDGMVTDVRTLDGRAVPPSRWPPDYAHGVLPDGRRWIAVGDMWWVPPCLALAHGGAPESNREAFLATRAWMASPAFRPTPVPGLREAIARLGRAGVMQAVATNSPAPESEVLLERLGLMGLFDRYVYEAGKPAGLEALLQELLTSHGTRGPVAPSSVLSIGDNPVNDVLPALALGCRAVFIDRHGTGAYLPADRVLRISAARELPSVLGRLPAGDVAP